LTYVKAHDFQVDVVQKIMKELDAHSRAEKNHHLLGPVLLQELEKKFETVF